MTKPKTKTKKRSKDDTIIRSVCQVVAETSARLDGLVSVVDDMVKNNPDYYGGLQVRLTLDSGQELTFYMVSDMFVNDPYLEFYHLDSADPSNHNVSLKSFAAKPEKQKLQTYVKNMGKDNRWNRIHEQFYMANVVRIQTLGSFMYSKFWNSEDNRPKIKIDQGSVVPFIKKA